MLNSDKIHQLRSRAGLLPGTTSKTRIILVSALFLAICAFGAAAVAPLVPDASDLPVRSLARELALPDLASQIDALGQSSQTYVQEEKVRPGDTLAAVLARLGVDDDKAEAFIKADPLARGVLKLKPGKRIQARTAQ